MPTEQRNIEIAEITAMMSTEGGRNFVRRILEYSGVFNETFDLDAHKHAYNAGRRKVGLYLIDELQSAVPDKYIQLLRERQDE